MTLAGDVLDTLLQPLGRATFFRDCWERRHCHLSCPDPARFEAIVTPAEIEQLISQGDLRYPALRLARTGGFLPPELYTRNLKHDKESFDGVPDTDQVLALYRDGATVVLPAVHRSVARIGRLCRQLQAELDHAVHANLYLTPGGSAGFTPHYDVHEVLVLQIAGRKTWQIFAPPLTLPHRSQPFLPELYRGEAPVDTVTLEAGDVLYLPRGVIHSTTTGAGYSAHLTLGITVYTWIELLQECLAQASADPVLRRSLPPGFAHRAELDAQLRDGLRAALQGLAAHLDTAPVIAALQARVRKVATAEPTHFRLDATVIEADTPLTLLPQADYELQTGEHESALIHAGVRYPLTAEVARALAELRANGRFRPADLAPQLGADAALALCRALAGIGLVGPDTARPAEPWRSPAA